MEEALAREVSEETGWQLTRIDELLGVHEWEALGEGGREFDFLVSVSGDLERPALEMGKVNEARWLGPDGLEVLKENRPIDDLTIFHLVQRALSLAPRVTADPKND